MIRFIKSFVSLALLMGAAISGPATAAVQLSDAFDAAYFSPSESGRGILVDVAPQPNGEVLFFGAQFTYDANGNPTWLTLQGTFLEHQFKNEVKVFKFTGGSFGFPFSAPTQNQVGTAVVTVNSCNSISFNLDMNDGSGFQGVELKDLQPVGGPSPTCVYRSSFSSCPGFATPVEGFPRACALSGVYLNQNIVLTNDTTWVINGLVRFGNDNAQPSTLTIELGTVIAGGGGSGSTDYIYISPGSRIFANGEPYAPIVLTSEANGFIEGTQPPPGELGGLVISGNAPANACPEAPFNCFSEFDQTQRFGGNQPHDSSGNIHYMQIRYAGIEFAPDSEVNAFTFQAVGDGTSVHHIQAYRGADDGAEFFGGTVNAKYLVVTEGGDDAVDWDLGYSGLLQYGLVVHGQGFGEDFGIEGANNGDNFDATPRATPIVANYTFIGNGNGSAGIQLKEGSGGQIYNSIVTGFPVACITLSNSATYEAAGTPSNPSGITAFPGVILDCGTNFLPDEGAPYTVQDLFNAFPGNAITNAGLNSYLPGNNSPALNGGVAIPDAQNFFDTTIYRGAFSGREDWTEGWTFRPGGS